MPIKATVTLMASDGEPLGSQMMLLEVASSDTCLGGIVNSNRIEFPIQRTCTATRLVVELDVPLATALQLTPRGLAVFHPKTIMLFGEERY